MVCAWWIVVVEYFRRTVEHSQLILIYNTHVRHSCRFSSLPMANASISMYTTRSVVLSFLFYFFNFSSEPKRYAAVQRLHIAFGAKQNGKWHIRIEPCSDTYIRFEIKMSWTWNVTFTIAGIDAMGEEVKWWMVMECMKCFFLCLNWKSFDLV